MANGPFRKLSRAMLVTSFGGQCRKKTAIFYEFEGFLRRLRVQKRALMKAAACNKPLKVSKILRREYKIQACTFG